MVDYETDAIASDRFGFKFKVWPRIVKSFTSLCSSGFLGIYLRLNGIRILIDDGSSSYRLCK